MKVYVIILVSLECPNDGEDSRKVHSAEGLAGFGRTNHDVTAAILLTLLLFQLPLKSQPSARFGLRERRNACV